MNPREIGGTPREGVVGLGTRRWTIRGGSIVGRHLRKAHATLKGEHQLAEYVARLGLDECARILAAAPDGLPRLASLRDECRVGSRETRSFEAVMRTWTLGVLSGAEGG